MTSPDDHGRRRADGRDADEPPTLFEKSQVPSGKTRGGRSRLPVGVIAAIFFAVLVVVGVILFVAAAGGSPPTGSTTGGGVVVGVLGLL